MRVWKTIVKAIIDALLPYDCEVEYHKPTSDGECGYFDIEIKGDPNQWSSNGIETKLEDVCKTHRLQPDWYDSNKTFSLNAYWDQKNKGK